MISRISFFRRIVFLSALVVGLALYAEEPFKVGLVLSGGGAKGIAHVGVIKALEDNDIPVDYVTGTSMGAIVGGFYSCGYSPEEMMDLFLSPGFADWSTGTINRNLAYYFNRERPTPRMLQVQFDFRDSVPVKTDILPESLINPLPMNFEFMRLFAPYTALCKEDFDDLFVPFRCVTSDVYHKRKIVCKSGSLADAIRASMSFPLVFKPIEMDGVLVYDGGIYDNFPVDVMQDDFHPDFIIGVSVSSPDSKPQQGDMLGQLEDMIIQNNNYDVPSADGIKIQVPVLQFGVLDFGKAQEIYDIGYRTGLSMVDSIRSRISVRRDLSVVNARRREFAKRKPELIFDSVRVNGASPREDDYLKYVFTRGEDRPFGIDQAQEAYYEVVTTGKITELFPQASYDSKRGMFSLSLDAGTKDNFTAGAGGWLTTSVNSMLYLSAGYHTLSLNSLDASIAGWLGQSYYAGMLDLRFGLRTPIPSCLELEVVMSRHKFYESEQLFYQDNVPTFVTDREAFLRLNFNMALGRQGKGFLRAGYGHLRYDYYRDNNIDFSSHSKDRTQYKIGMVGIGYESNTLDNDMYPSSGKSIEATVSGVYRRFRFDPEGEAVADAGYDGYFQGLLGFKWKQFFNVADRFAIGVATDAYASFHKLKENYTATLIGSPEFGPTPSTSDYFNPAFRSPSYLAAGVLPVWKIMNRMQLRGDFYYYTPVRNLADSGNGVSRYFGWFRNPQFLGEVSVVYNFPFASLALYGNYLSSPGGNWNFGLSFGLNFKAPRLLR